MERIPKLSGLTRKFAKFVAYGEVALNRKRRWRVRAGKARNNMELKTSVDRRIETLAMKGPSGQGSILIKTEEGWKPIVR